MDLSSEQLLEENKRLARILVTTGQWDLMKNLVNQYANAQLMVALQLPMNEGNDRQRVVQIAMHHVLCDCIAWVESLAQPDADPSSNTFIPFSS